MTVRWVWNRKTEVRNQHRCTILIETHEKTLISGQKRLQLAYFRFDCSAGSCSVAQFSYWVREERGLVVQCDRKTELRERSRASFLGNTRSENVILEAGHHGGFEGGRWQGFDTNR